MRIEPKLMLQDIGAPQFWTDYKFWVSTRGNYKNPAEQAIAESIDELVEYAQVRGEHSVARGAFVSVSLGSLGALLLGVWLRT